MGKKTKNAVVAAGWYPDPSAPDAQQRYWDGAAWTEHIHKPEEAPPSPLVTTEPVPPASGQPVEFSRERPLAVKGVNGQVSFDGDFVTIKREGFAARATIGKGDKRLPVSSITAVQ